MDRSKDKFFNQIHLQGRLFVIVVIIAFILVPVLTSLIFNVSVDAKQTWTATLAILSFMAPLAVGEFFAYGMVLGPSTYLALVAGNINNMKLPVVVSGLEMAGVEDKTKEAEIIKLIAVAVGTLAALVLMFVGMLAVSAIAPFLSNPVFSPAFSNILPCVMGALFVPLVLAKPKAAILPIVLTVIGTLVLGYKYINSNISYVIIVLIIITSIWEYYRAKVREKNAPTAQAVQEAGETAEAEVAQAAQEVQAAEEQVAQAAQEVQAAEEQVAQAAQEVKDGIEQ